MIFSTSSVLSKRNSSLDEAPREIFIVFFCFFGDRMFEYLFITGRELRKEQLLAGRLASIKVIFSDTYEKMHYTEEQISQLYAELDLEQ